MDMSNSHEGAKPRTAPAPIGHSLVTAPGTTGDSAGNPVFDQVDPGTAFTVREHFHTFQGIPGPAWDHNSGPVDDSEFAGKLSADLFKDGAQFLNVLKDDFNKIANSDFAKNLFGDLQIFGN